MFVPLFSNKKKVSVSITIHKWDDILTPGLQQLKARSFPQIQNTQYSWLDILRGLKAAFFLPLDIKGLYY